MNTFMEKFIDWKEFELFVKGMYEDDPNLIAKHDVTLKGKSGAKRQIDVLITQNTKLHQYITIVECKRWKQRVSRDIIDILYASIEDLNASKGVIFTTTGYEKGAEKYAQSKNIDIFIVREMAAEEWGLPGREIHFYLHTIARSMEQFQFINAKLIPTVEEFPKNLSLEIEITKDKKHDEKLQLYSIKNGKKGCNLTEIILEKQQEIMKEIAENMKIIEQGMHDASLVIYSPVEVDFSKYEYRQLRYQFGVINLDKIKFRLLTHISQSLIHFDRGEKLEFALTVENYIKKQKYIVSQKKDEDNIILSENLLDKLIEEKVLRDGDVLQNNSILKVYLEPYVQINLKGNEKVGYTELISKFIES
ncbi:restriction endonuclease [Lutibacter sp. B2]|nr:restriction endonuclease [Lutibacter sp. B2]